MGSRTIAVSLPLDADGFLRRECPHCERQFKWWHTPSSPESETLPSAVEAYFCPYCHEPASPTAWWTKEQLEFSRLMAFAEVSGPRLRGFKGDLDSLSRSSFLQLDVKLPSLSRPDPLFEPNDMVRVECPCHLDEPIKVDDSWEQDVACLVCGITYQVGIVRVLPPVAPVTAP